MLATFEMSTLSIAYTLLFKAASSHGLCMYSVVTCCFLSLDCGVKTSLGVATLAAIGLSTHLWKLLTALMRSLIN